MGNRLVATRGERGARCMWLGRQHEGPRGDANRISVSILAATLNNNFGR